MLIHFTLAPVENVQPWGSAGDLSLSWFGLTDGQYWIGAGESTLFEYSEHVRSEGGPRYCDYQVVRLYEDLTDMLPHILEPVPDPLVQYLSGDTGIAWQEMYGAWFDRNADHLEPDEFLEIIDASNGWTGRRRLDSSYLSPSANIVIWSDLLNVHIEWDNRAKFFDGKPAWTASCGRHQISRERFVAEVRSFHTRLMDQMARRVDQVLSGALSPEIKIDMEHLVREHQQRCDTLDHALGSSPRTDWRRVEKAINEILRS